MPNPVPNSANEKTIVITRPLGDEIILRDELLERGYRIIHEPLTEIFLRHDLRLHVEQALVNEPDSVIVTSKHGVQSLALLTEMRDMFLLCVGEATANIANQFGFERISVTGESVDHMIDYIFDAYDEDSRFLYISAEDVSVDLGEALSVRAMHVDRIATYEAMASEKLSDTIVEQLKRGQINALTFFSARTAGIFMMLAEKAGVIEHLKKIDAFCLGASVASSVRPDLWQKTYTADKATLASMVSCIDNAYRS